MGGQESDPPRSQSDFDRLSGEVIGAAIEVHRNIGPGLLESVYERCLRRELRLRGIAFESQVAVPVVYKGESIEEALRLDLIVERSLVVEIKSIERLHPVHEAQLLSYLRLSNSRLGLLINFNVPALKDGVRRVVHNL